VEENKKKKVEEENILFLRDIEPLFLYLPKFHSSVYEFRFLVYVCS
jgi:hypothetical protein